MENFWDYSVWGTVSVFAVLFCSLLLGNILRKIIPFLKKSLIPTSVIGGVLLILICAVYKSVTGEAMFDTAFFGGNGTEKLEIITYHALALGFIASTLKNTEKKLTKKRTGEIFDTGVTTVSVYLLQGIIGLAITLVAALVISGFFPAAGILLPFGYGQGTGQALNYGTIYETQHGFEGGKSFGLTIAAFGFISAAIGGVLHLNISKCRGRLKTADETVITPLQEAVAEQGKSFSASLDRMTTQISLIALVYFISYGLMYRLGELLPGMKAIIYGFNFLIGVLVAMMSKLIMKLFKKLFRRKTIAAKEYTDDFILTRTSNFCFDVMIISGIAAIRLDIIENFWGILIILGVVGAISTFIYTRVVARKLFPEYAEEQFLMMYGMLTGTASTGTILLREIDGEFESPAMDNMIYQNLPAIVLGFPMMLVATLAPEQPLMVLGILVGYFTVLNIILFRKKIFRRKKRSSDE